MERKYAVAVFPCPVLNTFDFLSVFGGEDGETVKTDENGFIRELEFIASVGTPFEIISVISKSDHSILQVTTPVYPSKIPIYIDSRFIAFLEGPLQKKEKLLLPAPEIIRSLKAMKGSPYMWGGNYNDGIEQMMVFYPPAVALSPERLSQWRLEGVDCSGLIFQASQEYTPRNTSWMINFGKGVSVSGLSAREISDQLLPLDLIVLPGHVVIVLDEKTTIESSHTKGGVVISDIVTRLDEIMQEWIPMDEWDSKGRTGFVVRRWYD